MVQKGWEANGKAGKAGKGGLVKARPGANQITGQARAQGEGM